MKPILISVILAAFLAVGSINTLMAQTPEQLYQKGLTKEEGEGALQDAISIYTKVADNSTASISLRAKALLHIGKCFEKLGTKEAVKAYQRLIANFPTQKNEVAYARERLTMLTPAGSSKEIAVRKVWGGSGVDQLGSVSADGGLLTFVDWDTGNLAVRNLNTGQNRPITNEGSWKDQRQYALFSLISPEATHVVYLWYNAEGITDLRLIKIGNPSPVILYTPESKNESMVPGAWFSDGKKIIVQTFRSDSKSWKLVIIDVITREIKILKEMKPGPANLSRLSLSPSEKQIAFDYPDPASKDLYDIYLLSIDSKAEIPLVKHPANDRLIGWLPGRNELLFTSDRTGTTDIWAVNASSAKPTDFPKRILTNIGEINPMGFKLDGSLYYGVQSHIFESSIMSIDQNTGTLSDSTRKVLSAPVFDICWLSDGENLICRHFDKNWNFNLGIYNCKSGVSKVLAENIFAYGSVRISSDEKSVLIYGHDKKTDEEGVYSVDIKTGIPVELMKLSQNDRHSNNVEWDLEGKNIFYTNNNHILKHNIENGEEKILFSDKNVFINPSLRRSSDGRYLFFDGMKNLSEKESNNEEIQLLSVPVEGGETKILCNAIFSSGGMYKRISVSPDGKYIYFSAKTPKIRSVLYRVTTAGGTPEIVWQSMDYNIAGISVHPDGKQIALSTSVSQVEIRAIENLGSEVTKVFSKNE